MILIISLSKVLADFKSLIISFNIDESFLRQKTKHWAMRNDSISKYVIHLALGIHLEYLFGSLSRVVLRYFRT